MGAPALTLKVPLADFSLPFDQSPLFRPRPQKPGSFSLRDRYASRRLHQGLRDLGFTLGTQTAQSAIIAVMLEDQTQAVAMWQALLELGLYVNMARPPATPAGTFLLRCSLCAEHTSEQVGQILGMFEAAGKATGVLA